MKVVLFCGGFGLRLREHDESLPKPMVPVEQLVRHRRGSHRPVAACLTPGAA